MLVPAVVEVSLPVFVYRYLGSAMQDLLIASANKESPISFYVCPMCGMVKNVLLGYTSLRGVMFDRTCRWNM